jgi:hypothetical protein
MVWRRSWRWQHRALSLAAVFGLSWGVCVPVQAWVLQVPKGGDFITLPQGRVLCGPVPEGWIMEGTRKRLRPKPDTAIGQPLLIAVAPSEAACSGGGVQEATLLVTGDHPSIDADSVTVALDLGRLELRGVGLEGVRIGFAAGDTAGSDVCLDVSHERDRDLCAVNIDRGLPADPQRIDLRWAPPGGKVAPDAIIFDKRGEPLAPEGNRIRVVRLLITRMFPDTRMVDVAHGEGKLSLMHPEAVSSADCGIVKCQPAPDGLTIGSVPAAAPKLTARLQLLPHVFLARGDAFDNVVGETLTVLRCPLAIVSGAPLRNVDELKVLVRLDRACVADAHRLRWSANTEPTEVIQVESLDDGVYVLLWIGRLSSERLSVVASRQEDGSVVAVASQPSAGFPQLSASLTLPGYGEVQFIPRNRAALVTVSHVPGMGQLVPVPLTGAYTVERSPEGHLVRGVYASGGYATLRFAYRLGNVPEPFRDTDFAVVVDSVQRPIREASIPAPIGASSITDRALVELFCKDAQGKIALIPPGTPIHIPYVERDSCRLVLHRERIPIENGEQRLDVAVSVTAVGGEVRTESHWSQQLVLRHSKDRDVLWIRGAKEQFDRIDVRITHVVDEWLYGSSSSRRLELPSSQWAVVTEDANFKFYTTAAIPASLYRFTNDPQELGNGPLTLNFGVLSRLTWLDSNGHEGLIAIEVGMMGMGLATDRTRQLAAVAGLGIAIPISNANQAAQAAINIHAWLSYTFGRLQGTPLDADGNPLMKKIDLSNWAFVFGPSITVGSVGALL